MAQTLFGATIVTENDNRGIFGLINAMRPVIAECGLDGESVGMRRNSGSDWELPGAFGFSQFMIISTSEAFIDALAALPTNSDGYAFEKVEQSLEGLIDMDGGTFQPDEMKAIGLFGDEGAVEYVALRDRIAVEDAAQAPLTNAELTEVMENLTAQEETPVELVVIDEAGNETDPEDEEFDSFDEDEDDDWDDEEDDDDFFDDDWDDDEEDWDDEE